MVGNSTPDLEESICRGVPLAELEGRLRPKNSASPRNGSFVDFSCAGFLGPDESLLELMEHDNAIVSQAQVSYEAIAAKLQTIMTVVGREQRRIADSWHTLGYKLTPSVLRPRLGYHDSQRAAGVHAEPFLKNSFRFVVAGVAFFGSQHCPWTCNEGGVLAGYLAAPSVSDADCDAWLVKTTMPGQFDDYQRNTKHEGSIPSADAFVPVTTLLPHLICEHHFFEGKGSLYRAEPATLIAALRL